MPGLTPNSEARNYTTTTAECETVSVTFLFTLHTLCDPFFTLSLSFQLSLTFHEPHYDHTLVRLSVPRAANFDIECTYSFDKVLCRTRVIDGFCTKGNIGCEKVAHLRVAVDFYTDSDSANGVVQFVFTVEAYKHNQMSDANTSMGRLLGLMDWSDGVGHPSHAPACV